MWVKITLPKRRLHTSKPDGYDGVFLGIWLLDLTNTPPIGPAPFSVRCRGNGLRDGTRYDRLVARRDQDGRRLYVARARRLLVQLPSRIALL